MTSHAVGSLEYLRDKYGDIFSKELGTIKSFRAKLSVRSGESPKFFKPRPSGELLKTNWIDWNVRESWRELPIVTGPPRLWLCQRLMGVSGSAVILKSQ